MKERRMKADSFVVSLDRNFSRRKYAASDFAKQASKRASRTDLWVWGNAVVCAENITHLYCHHSDLFPPE